MTIIEAAEHHGTAPVDGYYGYIIGTGTPNACKSPHAWFRDIDHANAWEKTAQNRVIITLGKGDAVFWQDYMILQFAKEHQYLNDGKDFE